MRVRELRAEYVRLGGEESTVRSLNKAKVLKAMYALVVTANEADARALIASTESVGQRGVARRITDAAWVRNNCFQIAYNPARFAVLGDPTPAPNPVIITEDGETQLLEDSDAYLFDDDFESWWD